MIIFHKSVMIGRERERSLAKALYRQNSELNSLNGRKNNVQDLIDSLDPVENAVRISRLQWRIVLIDRSISKTTQIIANLTDQLNNLNYKIVDTVGLPNDRESQTLINLHNYSNYQPVTFAPNYPVRFYS